MKIVTESMNERFPKAQQSFLEVFSAVADGLALAQAGITEVAIWHPHLSFRYSR